MAVSKRTRFEVLRRDNYTCRYCRSTDNPLTIDHVTPVALGGTDAPENLVSACRDCNSGKGSTSPDESTVDQVEADALRWSRAMQRAALERAIERDQDREWVADFRTYWDDATAQAALPIDWERSVRQFRTNGVSVEDMQDATNLAVTRVSPYSRNHFRYFCGICWGIVREINARAEQIVNDEEPADG